MAPPVEETPVDVNDCLDQLLLRLMDDLEALEEKRRSLNPLIEKGWFCLSQSRYSMGNKSVSSLQYKPEMKPSMFVQDSTAEDGATTFTVEHVQPREQDKADEEKDVAKEVETIGAADQVLRHRGHKVSAEAPKPTTTEDSDKPKSPTSDPLRWFGVLVPQSLRQAQSNFRQGILLAADVASLQSSIEETRRKYRALLAQKKREQVQSG
ncbi:coiled-coil domain-containing protein 115 [Hyla sarda]|uniref:coiled-coil domain-containing protein 115 n=1 Tax=Hyla sarda TaxID=327740 RepID=UPI0024C2EBAE|nr:coiled-coil domain-containing protein 115 [Hyla sarda]XP_056394496.1 coiled-coil domain-containing protein 115 [Hyla sarda]XP_056394497.1 coiled-coil domain-containing protein 115 [Hyla sarda]XP_056394499.1 coiled-coil domain-containing protein 115 [Hyla sarda]